MNPISQEPDENLDDIYGGVEIDISQTEKKKKPTLKEIGKDILKRDVDVAQQVVKRGIRGFGGAYGNILNLFGLNDPVSEEDPEQQRFSREFDIIEQLGQRPGSFQELSELSGDDFLTTRRFPTSEDVDRFTGLFGLPEEASTREGRYAGRTAEIFGGGLALGATNPLPAVFGGTAGQTAEEFGASPLTQAVVEIVAMLGGGAPNALSSRNPQVQARIAELRNLGYADQEIQAALRAAEQPGFFGKLLRRFSKKTGAAEDVLTNTARKSEELIEDMLSNAFPGLKVGDPDSIRDIHTAASEIYGPVAQESSNLAIRNPSKLNSSIGEVVDEIKTTLGNTPEELEFIKFLETAKQNAQKGATGDYYINFYQTLNRIGKWVSRDKRDRYLTKIKDGIKETFKDQGSQGKVIAEGFDTANKAVQKAYQAEKASKILEPAFTQDGINFKRLGNLLNKSKNVDELNRSLGRTQTHNLRVISNIGKDIGDFAKTFGKMPKTGWVKTAEGSALAFSLYHGDYDTAGKILATSLGGRVAGEAAKRLATNLLLDPKYQNLTIRGLNALKNNSSKAFQRVNDAWQRQLAEDGIDVGNLSADDDFEESGVEIQI